MIASDAPRVLCQPGRRWLDWRLLLVIGVSLTVRLYGLDYNGPFIDESFYSVAILYGNVPYITGDAYLFPALAFAATRLGGVTGARALTAVFGTLTVVALYRFAGNLAMTRDLRLGRNFPFLGALAFSLSAPAILVSALATYDAMAYMLFAAALWSLSAGFREQKSRYFVLGALGVFLAFASRYMMLIYAPVAAFYVLSSRFFVREEAKTRGFWLTTVALFLAYRQFCGPHFRAALANARWLSAAGLPPVLSSATAALQSLEGVFGAGSPVALAGVSALLILPLVAAAAAGLSVLATHRPLAGATSFDVLTILAGAAAAPAYHVWAHAGYVVDKDMAMSAFFFALLAGIALARVVDVVRARQGRVASGFAVFGLAAVMWSASFPFLKSLDSSWPDWRPVVAAAKTQGAEGRQIWSTANEGRIGNVWQLRTDLGAGVDVASPWYIRTPWERAQVESLLAQARAKGVEFVIGPMGVDLGAGDRIEGFAVVGKVGVRNGPAAYILKADSP